MYSKYIVYNIYLFYIVYIIYIIIYNNIYNIQYIYIYIHICVCIYRSSPGLSILQMSHLLRCLTYWLYPSPCWRHLQFCHSAPSWPVRAQVGYWKIGKEMGLFMFENSWMLLRWFVLGTRLSRPWGPNVQKTYWFWVFPTRSERKGVSNKPQEVESATNWR